MKLNRQAKKYYQEELRAIARTVEQRPRRRRQNVWIVTMEDGSKITIERSTKDNLHAFVTERLGCYCDVLKVTAVEMKSVVA